MLLRKNIYPHSCLYYLFLFSLLISCGLPSFQQIPNPPEIVTIGINNIAINLPADLDTNSGIAILYKIYLKPSESEYVSEYGTLESQENGNLAYRALEQRGFKPFGDDPELIPAISYGDYGGFFDEAILLNGLESSSSTAAKTITISLTNPAGLQIILEENAAISATISLQRNSGIVGNRDFFPVNNSNYNTSDEDLEKEADIDIASIASDDLYISLAIFTYIARTVFGEDHSYSKPYILKWSELFQS